MKYFLAYLVTFLLNERRVIGDEICCCPDFNAHLTCKDTANTKLESNGYRCVAETGSTVTLQCYLTDADHPAVQSLRYMFYKAAELDSSALSNKANDAKQIVCADETLNTCNIEDVQWGASLQTDDLDTHDSFIYQCSVEVTLIDDATFSIHSSTMWLDVLYNINITSKVAPDEILQTVLSVDTGNPYVRLNCDMDVTNPPTKATWYFKKEPNETGWSDSRVNIADNPRMILVDDKIDNESANSFKIGTLVLMLFKASDAGYYKCVAKYDPGISIGAKTEYTVSQYKVDASGNSYGGTSQLKKVSAITSSKYTFLGESVDFTCYMRDTDASPELYRWVYENNTNYEPIEVTRGQFSYLSIKNNGRTLSVPSHYRFHGLVFKCEVTKDNVTKMSEAFSQPVIVPKVMNIPLSSRVCVNSEDSLITMYSSSTYMMSNNVEVAEYVQKLPGSSHSWFLGGTKITAFSNKAADGGVINERQLTISSVNHIVASQKQCQYYSFVQRNGNNYQIQEVIKVNRYSDNRCADLDATFCKKSVDSICDVTDQNNPVVRITIKDATAQCMSLTVRKNGNALLRNISFPKTAESCSARELSFSFSKDDTREASLSGEYTWSLTPEGKTGCSETIDIRKSCILQSQYVVTCSSKFATGTTPWNINASRSCELDLKSLRKQLGLQASVDGCYRLNLAQSGVTLAEYTYTRKICNSEGLRLKDLVDQAAYDLIFSWKKSSTTYTCTSVIKVACNSCINSTPGTTILVVIFIYLIFNT